MYRDIKIISSWAALNNRRTNNLVGCWVRLERKSTLVILLFNSSPTRRWFQCLAFKRTGRGKIMATFSFRCEVFTVWWSLKLRHTLVAPLCACCVVDNRSLALSSSIFPTVHPVRVQHLRIGQPDLWPGERSVCLRGSDGEVWLQGTTYAQNTYTDICLGWSLHYPMWCTCFRWICKWTTWHCVGQTSCNIWRMAGALIPSRFYWSWWTQMQKVPADRNWRAEIFNHNQESGHIHIHANVFQFYTDLYLELLD